MRSDIKVKAAASPAPTSFEPHTAVRAVDGGKHPTRADGLPQRDERQGWVNDRTVRIEEIIYNFSCGAFLRKWMKDLADTQEADGSIGMLVARVFGADKADPLSSIFLFVPWYSYMFFRRCGHDRGNTMSS